MGREERACKPFVKGSILACNLAAVLFAENKQLRTVTQEERGL